MRIFRLFGLLIIKPENRTDRQMLKCMTNETKAQKIEIAAVEKSGRPFELKGVMFCEYAKNCDAHFDPWPVGSSMARIRAKGKDS